MPRKLSAAIEARLVELSNGGRTPERQIATVLKREGHDVTASGVHRALSRLGLAGKGKRAAATSKATQKASSREAAPVSPPAPDSVPALAPAAELDADDLAGRLQRTIANLETASKQAETDKDPARVVACGRAITAALSLLSRLTPAPPPDVNDRPDMIAAARRAREAAHAFFDRLLEAAS